MRLFAKLLTLAFLSIPGALYAQVSSYAAFNVTNPAGQVLSGASVALCSALPTQATPCGGQSLVQTYTDSTETTQCTLNAAILGPTYGVGCTNPGLSDGFGTARFFATSGFYGYQVFGSRVATVDVETIILPLWNGSIFSPEPANTVFGNCTLVTALPTFCALTNAMMPTFTPSMIPGNLSVYSLNSVVHFDGVHFTTLAAAVAACPVSGTLVVDIPGTWTVTSNLTIPSTCTLEVKQGAILSPNNAVTLTINGPVSAGNYQIFSGAGIVVLSTLSNQIPVEWFGAVGDWNGTTGTDNTTAIQNCINSITIGSCLFQGKSYKITAALSITKSSVGITGVGSALFNSAIYASVPPSTIIISTSASADIIDVVGASSSQVLGGTILKNLNLERSVVPSGTAKGINTTFAQGEMYSNIVSQDSIYGFYFRGTGSIGYGYIENCATQWGFVGVTETSGALYGFYIDSTSSVASPSLRIRNSFAVSNITSGTTSYGIAAVGNQLSDLHVNHFESAQNMNYGEYLSSSNSFILDSFDIHFVDVINDSCVTYCLYATGIGGSINVTGGESLCTSTCTSNYDIESSSNVSITNHVFYNFGTGDVLLSNNSTNINLFDSTILGGSNSPVVYNSVSNSHFNSNMVSGALASTGITFTSSSNNTIVGNSIFNATTGISLDAASNNNTGLETLQCTSVSGNCVNDSGGSYYGGGVRQFCGSTGLFAPTISSGFNSGAIGPHTNGTCFFTVTVGTGTAGSTGVIGIASNTNGWVCQATNQTRADQIQQTGSTANSVTFTNFGTTYAATNWTNSDQILISCGGLH